MKVITTINETDLGIPRWSSSYDSKLSLPGARVQSPVGELKSRKPRGSAKKKKKKKKETDSMELLQKSYFLHGISTVCFIE